MVVVAVVAAVLGGVLALAAWNLVRDARETDFAARSVEQADRWLALLSPRLGDEEALDLLERLAATGPLEFVAAIDGQQATSQQGLSLAVVPDTARRQVDDGRSSTPTRIRLDRAYLVVGGQASRADTSVFFLFDESALQADLDGLQPWVVAGWVATVVAAVGLAWLVMRRRMGRLAAARDREHRFTADVAHELRTPLGAMVTAASLLESGDGLPANAKGAPEPPAPRGDGPPVTEPTRVLIDGTRRMQRLVDHLLELARLDTKTSPSDPERLRLGEVLHAVLARRGDPDAVTVSVDHDVVVWGDRMSVARIIGNLVDNALEHGGNHVEATAHRNADEVVLTITDDGPGIDEDDLAVVFDRFHTSDESRSGGTGLGLAIAHEHARLLGGTLTAANRDDGGAVFTLQLPAADPPPGP